MQNLTQVTDASFQADILRAPVPVLVDFWGPQCGYCRAMAPIVEELAREFGSRLRVVGVNATAERRTAAHFGIQGLPTFLLVRDGTVREQLVGAVTKTRLRAAIEEALTA